MEKQKSAGNAPDFRNGSWACWINKDKNGNKYLSVKIDGIGSCNLFKYEPKKEQQQPTVTTEEVI